MLSLSPHPGEEAVNNTLPSAFHHPALRFFAGAGSPLPYLFNPVFCSMLPHSIIFIISCTCGRRMTSNVTWPSPSSCLVDDDSHGAPTHHHLTPLGRLKPGVLFIFIIIVCVFCMAWTPGWLFWAGFSVGWEKLSSSSGQGEKNIQCTLTHSPL